jgi:hypothetical protein
MKKISMWFGVLLIAFFMMQIQASDQDKDGISDAHEKTLGSNPAAKETFKLILKEGIESEKVRKLKRYDASKDIIHVENAHSGDNRFMWRVNFAKTPKLKDTVLHLYVDADANYATGRKGSKKSASTGTDYMVSLVRGKGYYSRYSASGKVVSRGPVSFCVDGKAIIMSVDVDLTRNGENAKYALYVLCHSIGTGSKMSDSTRKQIIEIPLVKRKKITRPKDIIKAFGTKKTYGLDNIRQTLRRKEIVAVPYDKLKTDGFKIDDRSARRYGHVSRTRAHGAKVWTFAPKGRYYVGYLMYDDSSNERIIFKINDVIKGMSASDANNYRHWIHWLKIPVSFKGGEKVELLATGPTGRHGLGYILFMPTPPPESPYVYTIKHMASHTNVGEDGTVTISWTSQMPTTTHFEYGSTTAYGKTANFARRMLVHRVVLKGLKPDKVYHGRAAGKRPDGSLYYSPDYKFQAKAKAIPATIKGVHHIPLTVKNPHKFAAKRWPVTTGIPFPQGVLGSIKHVQLNVPSQIKTTARWLDGSIKWILVTFMAEVPAGKSKVYELKYGRDVKFSPIRSPQIAKYDGNAIQIGGNSGGFKINTAGEIVLPSGLPCRTAIRGKNNEVISTKGGKSTVTIEDNGPLRAVIKTVTDIVGKSAASPAFRIEKRLEFYAGLPLVRVRHTFIVQGKNELCEINDMTYSVPSKTTSWQVDMVRKPKLKLTSKSGRLQQRFDDKYIFVDKPSKTHKGRIIGNALGADSFIGLRHFWQNYPKSFDVSGGYLKIGLCPDFTKGLYDKFPFEREGHHLYFYLLNGVYKFPRGMAKTHEMMLFFGNPKQQQAIAALFQRPLLATAPPKWYCGSNAFYAVAPRNKKIFKVYEESIDRNLKRYLKYRERVKDYGLMNYGDWYGERGANWGNIEYDTQHAFLLEYIRSGNETAFFLADETEKHNRDVDTVHWNKDPLKEGFVYVHQMGHTGRYYKKSVPGTLGFPKAGGSVSHSWTEGHFNHYFLTGDQRSYDTGRAIADYYIRKDLSHPYEYTSCRVPGWHLIINAIAYASTSDPYYLNASRVIVDRVLEAQDKQPRPLPEYQREPGRTHQVGGWSRMMVPGHCKCTPRHRGNAGFMVAVLLSGLKYYHDVTGDPAVKQAIIKGAYSMLDEGYSTDIHGFRYTSCPNTGYRTGCSPLMAEGIARAYLWTRDPRFKDVLTEALPRGAGGGGYGKPFSMYYRVAPRVLADMAAAGLTMNKILKPVRKPFKRPAWMKGKAAKKQIVLQAEKFTSEGVGICRKRGDRQGTWGDIITSWHANPGHWLEWTANIPESGKYYIRFRYATDSKKTLRDLKIDGKIPVPEAAKISFPWTGGYGHSVKNWHILKLKDKTGKEIPINFAKGKHKIRMSNLNDGLAMDFIILVPVEK